MGAAVEKKRGETQQGEGEAEVSLLNSYDRNLSDALCLFFFHCLKFNEL